MISIDKLTVGERPAPIIYQFQDSTGVPFDLKDYTAKFQVRERDSTTVVQHDAQVVIPTTNGQVQYVWQGDELPTAGHYLAQFWVGNNQNRFASDVIEFDAQLAVGVTPGI